MLKYLVETKDRLAKLKSGIEKNPETWANQTVTPQTIQGAIERIDLAGNAIEEAQGVVTSKLSIARGLQAEVAVLADSIENLAVGLEKGNPNKLNEYGIKVRKAPAKKTAPTIVLQPALEDDTDGEGFIVSTSYDPDADIYEWEKGTSSDPTKTDTTPELKFFKATKKTTFVDDDVVKGVRVFYRVRATNSAGNGPWSLAVSRVQ